MYMGKTEVNSLYPLGAQKNDQPNHQNQWLS